MDKKSKTNVDGYSIYPIHRSISGIRRRPRKMDLITMPEDLKASLNNIALSIFVDCVNVGIPLQDAVLAVYLSGLEHGHELRKDT